jgi:hypothetical protein
MHHMALQKALCSVIPQQCAREISCVMLAYEQTGTERKTAVATQQSIDGGCASGRDRVWGQWWGSYAR